MTVTTSDGWRYVWRPGASWVEVHAPGEIPNDYGLHDIPAPASRSVEALLNTIDTIHHGTAS